MERQKTSHDACAAPTNRVTEHLREGYDAAAECVAKHPGTSALVVFGVGFGMGLLLGHVLASPPAEERGSLAAFGRNVLETMSRCMPDALSKRLGA
jgi:hypothetical protein